MKNCYRANKRSKTRGFSLDVSFGLLAIASASALAQFLGSAFSFCGLSCMICERYKKKKMLTGV